jgi:formylglycine-generating enzyme required for sulfatase activity
LSNSKSPGVTLTENVTLFYIVLPTGTWEHGFTVDVYAADNTTIIDSLITTKPFTFESTNATMMAAKDVLDIPEPCMVIPVNETLSINLMCVEGGTFRMGVGAENYIERDDPQSNKDSTTHLVTLSDYYMAQTAVTQGLWKAVMGTDIHDMVAQSPYPDATPKVGDMYPMEYVRLKDALAFIDELNKLTGMHFRLPTEAEREYAARGGNRSRGYKYPGGDDYTKVASPYGTPVAQKLPNELGIYDLSGCTREMCTDTWRTTYIYDEHVVNPVGPIQNSGNRTMRGGHIHSKARPFTRYPYTPAWCGNALGFRIILPTETKRRMIHVSNTFFEMCFVEGGTFTMGSDTSDAQADEQPLHEVTLSNYYIGQTEVTQYLWRIVMGSDNNPSTTKGDNLPVTNISWDNAQKFVQRLSEMTGKPFRLPTEAEWEYAARGGQKSQGYTYAGSNNADSVAWHIWNTNKVQAVGKKKPNELGIFDMTGNVWEYCSDYYAPYEASAQLNPQGPASSPDGTHVTRGGGWRQNPGYDTSLGYCRTTNRAALPTSDIVGLRIVLEVEK